MKIEELFEMYTALILDSKSRRELQKKFPPKYPDFIGHHITLKFGLPKDTPKPKQPTMIEVVGYKDDGKGVEALVVAVNGKTNRPNGSTYHITWSIDRSAGRKPVDSNKILKDGFDKVEAIPIKITPEVLK
jgi:hypothetical protein